MPIIRLLGGAAVEGPEGPVAGRGTQRARLALLAILAISRSRGVPRERLMVLLWPDGDPERVRHQLRDSVYRLREAVGERGLMGTGDLLRLDPAHVRCDVWDFEDAAAAGQYELSDRLYPGPFLDGFFLDESPEFDQWAANERRRLAAVHADVVERLAAQVGSRGDWLGVSRLLERLVIAEPYQDRYALLYMRALEAAGDRAGALRHADLHLKRWASEFGTSPDQAIHAEVERLRTEPNGLRPVAVEARVGPAPATTPEHAPVSPSAVGALRRWRARAVAAGVAGLVALSGGAWWIGTHSSGVPLDSNVVAVVPFKVTAPDSSTDYLGEGIVDLAAVLLNGEGAPTAIDSRAMLIAYRRERDLRGAEPTTAQMLELARRFHAGQLLMGEIVVTPAGTAVSARLLDVASRRVIANHAEQGSVAIRAITHLIASLLAESYGEAASRLSGLSDSVEAVRAYLIGMRTYRGSTPWESFGHVNRALEIDPTFATAAFWRAFLAGDAYVFGTPERRRIDSTAWALRGRLSHRDSLLLVTLPTIGPRFPGPSTSRELLDALERAVAANPDRIEVWDALAMHLVMFGSQAGVDSPLVRAARAADRALSLDGNFLPTLSLRTQLALLQGDPADIRVHSERFFVALADTTRALHWRWAVARALGDSSRLPSLLRQVAARRGFPAWLNIELWATRYGLSTVDDAERVGRLRLATPDLTAAERDAARRSLFRVATIRGQARAAAAMADSARDARHGHTEWDGSHRQAFITLGVVGPGFDDRAAEAVRQIEARRVPAQGPDEEVNDLCLSQLWRVSRADVDAAAIRRAIARMRAVAAASYPGPGWRVTRLDLCPQLLQAALDRKRGMTPDSLALDRLEALLLDGPQAEMPGNLARILVARWREAQGRYDRALALLRGADPMAWSVAAPALWLAEGRVAALASDTSAAVAAYSQYLALRDRPDPGPLADEVAWVQGQVAALRKERR